MQFFKESNILLLQFDFLVTIGKFFVLKQKFIGTIDSLFGQKKEPTKKVVVSLLSPFISAKLGFPIFATYSSIQQTLFVLWSALLSSLE